MLHSLRMSNIRIPNLEYKYVLTEQTSVDQNKGGHINIREDGRSKKLACSLYMVIIMMLTIE
jgi:hypothetical protein